MEHTYYNSNQCYNETAVDNMNLLKKDLSRFKTKTPEEQAVQLHKIHNGDYSELNDFLCENMGLCIYFARKYVAFVEPMWEIGDLVQESFIGLRTAALKYDPDNESGAAFSTYASFWIKQAIRRFIDNNIDTIRIPVHMKESYRKMKYGIGKGMNIKIPKKNDYIIIKYQNGHKMVLIGASVKVEELTEKISQLNLMKGEAYASVEKLNPEENFVIKTKYADFAVRGTKFGVAILESKKKSYLSVEEGVVTATRDDMSIDVSANEELWSGSDSSVLKGKKAIPLISKKTRDIIKDMQNFKTAIQ